MEIKFAPGFFKSWERLFSYKPWFFIPRITKDTWHQIKWAWQRIFRGYDDRITWGLNGYLSEFMPKIIKTMIESLHGTPMNEETEEGMTIKEWKGILEKIALGFEAADKLNDNKYMKKVKLKEPRKDIFGEDSYDDYVFDQKIYDNLNDQFDYGMKLFHKYYFHLWD